MIVCPRRRSGTQQTTCGPPYPEWMVTLPEVPARRPPYGPVVLREFEDRDVEMVLDLATDPYIGLIGSLPSNADRAEALAYLARQRGRRAEGVGYSWCVADAVTDEALGGIGLWLSQLGEGRATAGYSIAPRARGRGVAGPALRDLTAFGWTFADLHRIELYIEPWNAGSIRTAEHAGYRREGLLRSQCEIGGRRVDMLRYAA